MPKTKNAKLASFLIIQRKYLNFELRKTLSNTSIKRKSSRLIYTFQGEDAA